VNLSPVERMFYGIAWELEEERKAKVWEAMTGGQ